MPGRRAALVVLAAVLVVGTSGIAFASARTPSKPPPLSTLKLLQFNVLQGATDGRARAVADVIHASGADVVTLDEVTVKSIFDQIAALTRFHAYWVAARDGYSVGILSRYPIRRCFAYTQPPLHHSAYGCRIPINGANWWIFGAHLCPCVEKTRVEEAAFLLSQMKLHPNGRVVLAGDLNSQTPGENDQSPLLVIPMIRSAGYVDAFRELHTVRQNPGFTISAPPYGAWERRLDYVFHSRNVRAVSARVISSVAGRTWPSDHAALYVSLVDRPAKPR